MKSKSKSILKTAFSVFLSLFIFSAFVYGYLYIDMKNSKAEADNKDYNVPYESSAPDNVGLLLELSQGSTLVYLDFEESNILLLDLKDEAASPSDYGYPADFVIKTSYDTIKTAVDAVGGIDLVIEEEDLRLTGVQVVEYLSTKVDTSSARREIFLSFFNKVSKNGILREDLIAIFESATGDITVPDYYRWADYLKGMSGRAYYVN
ncbi:MAG: hypothetical protein IJZ75_02280 [Clostridia bacterium]|nr:hypothetical protein [Clostridia bacterium]